MGGCRQKCGFLQVGHFLQLCGVVVVESSSDSRVLVIVVKSSESCQVSAAGVISLAGLQSRVCSIQSVVQVLI